MCSGHGGCVPRNTRACPGKCCVSTARHRARPRRDAVCPPSPPRSSFPRRSRGLTTGDVAVRCVDDAAPTGLAPRRLGFPAASSDETEVEVFPGRRHPLSQSCTSRTRARTATSSRSCPSGTQGWISSSLHRRPRTWGGEHGAAATAPAPIVHHDRGDVALRRQGPDGALLFASVAIGAIRQRADRRNLVPETARGGWRAARFSCTPATPEMPRRRRRLGAVDLHNQLTFHSPSHSLVNVQLGCGHAPDLTVQAPPAVLAGPGRGRCVSSRSRSTIRSPSAPCCKRRWRRRGSAGPSWACSPCSACGRCSGSVGQTHDPRRGQGSDEGEIAPIQLGADSGRYRAADHGRDGATDARTTPEPHGSRSD